jgi:ADP-heptose:LPS heptosyltransferase
LETKGFALKLLIIRPAALGDTLMLMPAIAQLRASAEITLVSRYPGLYFFRSYAHSCIDYEGPGWHRLFLEEGDDAPNPIFSKVDRVVAFLRDPDKSVINNLTTYLPPASVHLFPAFPPKRDKVHVAFYLARCLQRAGLPIDPRTSLEEACKRPLLGGKDPSIQQNKIIFHPGSGGKDKNYSPDFWLELIRAFRKSLFNEKTKFNLLLGPAEEQLLSYYRKSLGDGGKEMVFAPEKEKLKPLLIQATLYVGHDSGITHLAAMLGTPTVALFKNSSVYQWRPVGPAVKVIKSKESSQRLIARIIDEGKKRMKRD